MTELLIFISKYIFIILMLIFCLQSKYLVSKGRIVDKNPEDGANAVRLQRFTIILFHILAYATLTFNSEIPIEDYLLTATGGLVLVILAPILIGLVYNRINGLAINCMYLLMDISLVILQRLDPDLALKQMIFFFMGTGVILIIYPILKYFKRFEELKYFYLVLGFILLLVTIIFGSTVRGATNWIKIGGFSFQPAEIVKILFVFYFASVFCRYTDFKDRVIQTVVGFAFVALLVLQKDLGSALIFFMTFVIMLFVSTGSLFFTFSSIGLASVGAVMAYFLFSHIRVRIAAWLDPWSDISNKGYQISQSLFAIGSGGIWGSGLGKGYASTIPIVETDFIFSAICEEFGVIFAILMMFIYMTLFYCGVRSALNTRDKFKAVLASGLTGLICFQTFLIIGGVTKLIPLTGVTLPFVSYVVICTVIVGLLLWIYEPKTEGSEVKYGPDDEREPTRRKPIYREPTHREPTRRSSVSQNRRREPARERRRERINMPDEAPLKRRVRRRDDE